MEGKRELSGDSTLIYTPIPGEYSFQTRVASVGSVSESALKDGQWHSIVETDYEVTFANPLHISDSARVGWVWRTKVS